MMYNQAQSVTTQACEKGTYISIWKYPICTQHHVSQSLFLMTSQAIMPSITVDDWFILGQIVFPCTKESWGNYSFLKFHEMKTVSDEGQAIMPSIKKDNRLI